MKRWLGVLLLTTLGFSYAAYAQRDRRLGDNAALRYWAAFAQVEDSRLSEADAKELTSVVEGTTAYDNSKYKTLLDQNSAALKTLVRATSIPECDWGLDYSLGVDLPVDYVRKALALGRLNLLEADRLLAAGDTANAVRQLTAGIRFAQDVAKGGSLFATLVAKSLLLAHFRTARLIFLNDNLSEASRQELRQVLAKLGPQPLDWGSGIQNDLEALRPRFEKDPTSASSLSSIIRAYRAAVDNRAKLPALQTAIGAAPSTVAELIPSPARVLQEKQELETQLAQVQSLSK